MSKNLRITLRDYIDIFALEGKSLLRRREQLYSTGIELHQFVDQLINQLQRNTKTSISQIARGFNVSMKQLRFWRNGKSSIPLRILKQLSRNLNLESRAVQEQIERLSSSRGLKVTIPRDINHKLMEIFGRFCGDGSCGIYDGDYKFSVKEKNKAFIHQHSKDMDAIFGIKGKIIEYTNVAENVIRSKPLVLLFQQIFSYRPEFHKTFDVKPPSFINKLDWRVRKGFTTGLIDTEGSFSRPKSNQAYTFVIDMKNKYLMDEVATAFKTFKIACNYFIQRNRGVYYLRCYSLKKLNYINEVFKLKNPRHLEQLKLFNT